MTTPRQLRGLADAVEQMTKLRRDYDIKPGHHYDYPVLSVGEVDYVLTWDEEDRCYTADVEASR